MPLDPAWTSVGTDRVVLAVVHNVTSLTRLLDVVDLLTDDFRVQTVFTWTRSSVFTDGVAEFLADIDAICIPWEEAKSAKFDLAISASYGGELAALNCPLLVISHGMGYNKYLTTTDVFGLSRPWLTHGGAVVPSAIVLSHPEQLLRLKEDCPEAVPVAVLAGDPCLDRMTASLPWRRRYRQVLGVPEEARLVVVTSTWGRNSLFGDDPGLLGRLTDELPLDEYRVAAVLHPNVWHGHSAWQVRTWLDRARRSGLLVLPPRDGWRAALVAADVVIGDHGSVAFYGAVLGRPLLYATFPHDDVDVRSPVARLGVRGPKLDRTTPLADQLRAAIRDHSPDAYAEILAEATSAPGESAGLLRSELYRLMRLPEPQSAAAVRRVPEPTVPFAEPTAALVSAAWRDGVVAVRRLPPTAPIPPGAHLVVDDAEDNARLFELADVLTCRADRLTDDPETWARAALAARPSAVLACAEAPEGSLVAVRDGGCVMVRGGPPALRPSAVHAWLATGGDEHDIPDTCLVRAGEASHRLRFTPR